MTPRVLVADDDVAALDGLGALLSAWGFEVQRATDGRQALDTISAKPPAVVITDVVMPTMDGLELLTTLHASRPSLPVIVITGQGDDDTLRLATRKGAYGYLSKPIDVRQLKQLIKTAIDTQPPETQQQATAAG